MTKRRNRITPIFGYIIFKTIPHKDSAADAPPVFLSECAKRANSLTVIKRVLRKMTAKVQY